MWNSIWGCYTIDEFAIQAHWPQETTAAFVEVLIKFRDYDILLNGNTIFNFYRCTVHYGVYILFIYQQLHFLLNLEKINFTLEYT